MYPYSVCEINTIGKYYKEYYLRYAPLMKYRSLDIERSYVDDFYHESVTVEREYNEYDINLFPQSYEPYIQNMTGYGMDFERQIVFLGCRLLFEEVGITPKYGDEISFDGDIFLVLTVKRRTESYFAHTDWWFEWEIQTKVENQGS